MKPSVRIALIEDDAIIRRFMEDSINKVNGFSLDFSVCGLKELCDNFTLEDYNPDVILLDMVLDGCLDGGLKVIEHIKRKRRSLPNIIVMSGYCDEWMIRLTQQAGARGCISKSLLMEQGFLEGTIQNVMQRNCFVSGKDSSPVSVSGGSTAVRNLTEHQRKIIQMLKDGNTQSEIAAQLKKSVSTINNTVAQLKRKYKVKTIAALMDQS